MKTYDLNNKRFVLVKNSENGLVNSETIFEYKQEGNLVTADYYGGMIRYGKIIARLENDQLQMSYQFMTIHDEVKAGKAISTLSKTENSKIKMKLNWQWLTEGQEQGVSEYNEIE
jgi:hypothetical protein